MLVFPFITIFLAAHSLAEKACIPYDMDDNTVCNRIIKGYRYNPDTDDCVYFVYQGCNVGQHDVYTNKVDCEAMCATNRIVSDL